MKPEPGPRLEVDGRVVVEGSPRIEVEGCDWWKTFAYWWALPIPLLADAPVVKVLEASALEGVRAEAALELAWCPGPASVSIMETGHGDLFTRNLGGVVLAELRGLVLLTPDPMPVVVVSPFFLEVEGRACRFLDRIRGRLGQVCGVLSRIRRGWER